MKYKWWESAAVDAAIWFGGLLTAYFATKILALCGVEMNVSTVFIMLMVAKIHHDQTLSS